MRNAPKPLTFTLLRLLADGEFHSGEALAQHLGVSRASVNSALRDVHEYGLDLYSIRGRGYRLAVPPQWLDSACIGGHLGALNDRFRLEILESADSSNSLLLQRAEQDAAGTPSGCVLAVEWQSAGRGRLGRPWHAGLGNALTFSLLWRFDCGLSALSGLSLAVGVALMRALRGVGAESAWLKWPNDVCGENGKLAGILVEARGDMLGPATVVIGVGLNLSLPQPVTKKLDQPASCLSELVREMPERNRMLALILRELHDVLREFSSSGFAALRAEWESHHGLQNQPVRLHLPDGRHLTGTAHGVSEQGELLLQTPQGIGRFNAGEVSLRGWPQHAAD